MYFKEIYNWKEIIKIVYIYIYMRELNRKIINMCESVKNKIVFA